MAVTMRLVAGIDLGPETEPVVSYAALFAAVTHASVRLFYVIDYLLTPPSYLAEYIEEEKRREESEMAIWKAKLREAGVDAECEIVLGRLHESFLKEIEETGPSLLVIGFRSHLFRPSSSERLIKSLKVPILVVRGKASAGAQVGSVKIKRILCPVDFSENSKKAALVARQFAYLFSADLQLVHVIPSHRIKERRLLWKQLSQEERKTFDSAMRLGAEVRLSSFGREMEIDKEGAIYEGHPGEVITSLAEEGCYDLIIVGARGLSYVESMLIGGTTDAVLKSSWCPVLIVH
jgi:nucleotide-binding universal stress UspA family protein